MKIKELIQSKINSNYKMVATILKTSEWGAEETIARSVSEYKNADRGV